MIRDITIGQYYPAVSPVHALDPRTKLLGTLLYVTLLFLVRNPLWYLPILLTVLLLYRLAKVPFSYLLKGLRGILLLLLFTFFFRALYTPGTEIARFWIFSVTREGLLRAARMSSRIALMIAGASLLSYTSTPRELADGLERSLLFLERFGVPIRSMAVIVMIAFRFIPVLIDELNTLMDAQAARGAEFQHCSVFKKCKNVCSLLMPLFFSAVRKSADLAMAMEARGYRGEGETSRMYPLAYTAADRRAQRLMWGYFLLMGALVLTVR